MRGRPELVTERGAGASRAAGSRAIVPLLALLLAVVAPAFGAEDGAVIRAERIEPDGRSTFVPRWRPPSAPRWGLALSGGAAHGLAHIAVLRGFEEEGLTPDLVAGTSSGALIGGLYASGYTPDAIEQLFRINDWNSVFREAPRARGISAELDPLDPEVALSVTGRHPDGRPLRWRGVIPDWQIFREFVRYYGRASALADGDLDRLPIPFRAVACDLDSKQVYAPRHAPLFSIVRASMSLPTFSPVRLDGRVLVDGGVLENIPVSTARSMGAAFVVAVAFRSAEEYEAKSLAGLLGRTYAVAFAELRQGSLASADGAVVVDVSGIPGMDFRQPVDPLLEAGAEAWRQQRERVLAALEGAAPGSTWHDLRQLEGDENTPPEVVAKLAERLALDGTTRRLSSFRLEVELVRLLGSGAYDDAWFTVAADGRLRLSVVPSPRVVRLDLEVPPTLAPLFDVLRAPDAAGGTPIVVVRHIDEAVVAARRRGFFLAGITEVEWDRGGGALRVRVEDGQLRSVELVRAGGEPVAIPDYVRALEGRPANVDALERVVVRLRDAGGLARESSIVERSGNGYTLRLGLERPPAWWATFNLGLDEELGLVAIGRLTRPTSLGWKRWSASLGVGIGKEIQSVGFETHPPWAHPFVPYARIAAALPGFRLFDADGNDGNWRRFFSGIVSVGYRSRPTALGRLDLGLVHRWVSGDAFFPITRAAVEQDLSFEVAWAGDLRDDPKLPRKGMAWTLGGAVPLAGEKRPWTVVADGQVTTRLYRSERYSLALLGRIQDTDGEETLPIDRWGEPGVWWEAPGLEPGRGRAREYRRGTLVLRRDLGQVFGAKVTAAVSAAQWRLGEERVDPFVPRTGRGTALFLEASTARMGPLTAGVWVSNTKGNAIFVLLHPSRIAWPGPLRPSAGPYIP